MGLVAIFWILLGSLAFAVPPSATDFRADFYTRDMSADTVKGRGNAWLKRLGREVWADEIEFDFKTERAVARGNVHIKDGRVEIWCRYAEYLMKGEDAELEDAVVIQGQVVMKGARIVRHGKDHYVIHEGSYSNCNLDLRTTPEVADCRLDWRIYGRKIDIEVDGYAHIHDAIVYARDLPILYTPYFINSVKTKRQTGVLWPYFFGSQTLGTGISLPVFFALGPWQDLTFTPTYYTQVGYHARFDYRYIYDRNHQGFFNVGIIERKFSTNLSNPGIPDGSKRFLGAIGEASVNATNYYSFGGRRYSRQILRLVSDPYYTFDHWADVLGTADQPYLRSNFSYTDPGDRSLLTAQIQYQQSLVITKDEGVDRGAVIQLPTISYSRTNTPLLDRFFSYELDTHFTNFYRPKAFDQVPAVPVPVGVNTDADPSFDSNDHLRTGRRAIIEPRLIGNLPLGNGLQFQPVLRGGTMLYHFDYPSSSSAHREYADIEIPLSVYFSRAFHTSIPGAETIRHVVQPRVVYGQSLYQSAEPRHPFFGRDPATGLQSPRFDLTDQLAPFQYVRVELLNRLLRKQGGSISRFFLLQVANQYNYRLSQIDKRYSNRYGPLEVLSELRLWRLALQFQAEFQVEATRTLNGVLLPKPVRENSISTSLIYSGVRKDRVALSMLFRDRADAGLTERTAVLSFYKALPTFLDIEGTGEYFMGNPRIPADLRGYSILFHFMSKPLSCWSVTLQTGRNSYRIPFIYLRFGFDFGSPVSLGGKNQ